MDFMSEELLQHRLLVKFTGMQHDNDKPSSKKSMKTFNGETEMMMKF